MDLVIQQNFNRGDITLTKKFEGRGKKRLKNKDLDIQVANVLHSWSYCSCNTVFR